MKQLEDKGSKEIEKQGERGGKEDPLMTGKGEVSFPRSFLRDHRGHCLQFPQQGKMIPLGKTKTCKEKKSPAPFILIRRPLPGAPPEKLPTFILQEM